MAGVPLRILIWGGGGILARWWERPHVRFISKQLFAVTDGGLHPIPGEQFTRIGVINRVFYRATGVKKTYKCYSKVQTPSCFCNYFLYFLQN